MTLVKLGCLISPCQVSKAQWVRLALEARWGHLDLEALKASVERLDNRGQKESKGQLALLGKRVLTALLDPRVSAG